MSNKKTESIAIIGPTASGKTSLAVELAKRIEGEIISIDSRQFYREMDIGTGKDLAEYGEIPYHLIDVCAAGNQLNVSDFKRLFHQSYSDILARKKTPILCGGTGSYLLALLNNSVYTEIPSNPMLRNELLELTHENLKQKLSTYTLPLDYTPDSSTKKRCLRAIEILEYLTQHEAQKKSYPIISTKIFGLNPPVEIRRKRITDRLHDRINNGLIEEVQNLRKKLPDEKLIYYGLEYKYLTYSLNQTLDKSTAFKQLETQIHQFAKRQMTFFRKIEKDGFTIDWLAYNSSIEEKVSHMINNTSLFVK